MVGPTRTDASTDDRRRRPPIVAFKHTPGSRGWRTLQRRAGSPIPVDCWSGRCLGCEHTGIGCHGSALVGSSDEERCGLLTRLWRDDESPRRRRASSPKHGPTTLGCVLTRVEKTKAALDHLPLTRSTQPHRQVPGFWPSLVGVLAAAGCHVSGAIESPPHRPLAVAGATRL